MQERSPRPGIDPPIIDTPVKVLLNTRILFGAIVSGLLLFAMVMIVVKSQVEAIAPFNSYGPIPLAIGAAIAAVCFVAASVLYKRDLAVAKTSLNPVIDKLNSYRIPLLKYLALCEFPGLLGIVLYFLTGNYLALIITAAALGLILKKLPTRSRLITDLGLDWQQAEELE